MRFEQCLQTRSVEHLTTGIMGLYQAITVEEEALSMCQHNFMFLVARARHHPKRHTGRPEFCGAPSVSTIGRFMPRVGIVEPPTFRIKNSIEAGGKHPRWSFCIEQIVDPCEYLSGRSLLLGCGAEHRAGSRHHQGGRNPFTGNITDDEIHSTIFKREEIVEVAPDLTCSMVVGNKLPSRERRHVFGQKGLLNILGGP